MDALENIIQIIAKDTNEKIIKLREENDIKCKNIISEAEKCAKKEAEKNEKRIAQKKEQIISQTKTANSIFENKTILRKKHELINKVLDMSANYLSSMDGSEYFGFFSKLIIKNAPGEKFELLVGNKDFKRLPGNFLRELNLKNASEINCRCSDIFDYGFKIISSKSVIDLSLESVFVDNQDFLKSVALKALDLGEM